MMSLTEVAMIVMMSVIVEFHLEGADGGELDLNGEEADEADEETGELGRVEDVMEEPSEVGVLGQGEMEFGLEGEGETHEEWTGGEATEDEEVVVRHCDLRDVAQS
jgi:hypothetical protein